MLELPEGYDAVSRPMTDAERQLLRQWARTESRRMGVVLAILVVVAFLPAAAGEGPVALILLAGLGLVSLPWFRRNLRRIREMQHDAATGEVRETSLRSGHEAVAWNGVEIHQSAVAVPSEILIAINEVPLRSRGSHF